MSNLKNTNLFPTLICIGGKNLVSGVKIPFVAIHFSIANFSITGEKNIEKNESKLMTEWSIFFRRLPTSPIIACLYLQHIYIILTTIIRTFYTRPFTHYTWGLNTAISQTSIHKGMTQNIWLWRGLERLSTNRAQWSIPPKGPFWLNKGGQTLSPEVKGFYLIVLKGKMRLRSLLKTNFRRNKNSYWTI